MWATGDVNQRDDEGSRLTNSSAVKMSLGLPLLLAFSMVPTIVAASAFSAGAIDDPTVPITCSNAVMTSAPKFLSTPKGSARYPFTMKCTSPKRPGLMIFSWEGSWNPAETRQDRPNAVETLFIEGYEPFIPGRSGGRLFMYWTARCTADPWLQGGTCHRYGGYVPDDLRAAFPNIDARTFPLTENRISPSLKQQLIKQYQEVNQPPPSARAQLPPSQSTVSPSQSSVLNQTLPKGSQSITGSVQAPANRLERPLGSNLARSPIFRRGIESTDPTEADQAEDPELSPAESAATAMLEAGLAEDLEATTITLQLPLHVMGRAGETVVIEAGVYEIETILDVQLGIATAQQPTILLHANPGSHSEQIKRPVALLIPGSLKDELYLVFLKPNGQRFDVEGSLTGVRSRGPRMVTPVPDSKLKDAIRAAAAQQPSASPPCKPNPEPVGARWIPVPCSMPDPAATPKAPVP